MDSGVNAENFVNSFNAGEGWNGIRLVAICTRQFAIVRKRRRRLFAGCSRAG
jgi:hypothetical protein